MLNSATLNVIEKTFLMNMIVLILWMDQVFGTIANVYKILPIKIKLKL